MFGTSAAAAQIEPPEPSQLPPAAEPPRPFEQGRMTLGLAFGISTGRNTAVTLGGAVGYFVLPGLEPGVRADVTFGSEQSTIITALPYLRWIIYRSYDISPYVKLQGGRLFVVDGPDANAIGGGGGVVVFVSPRVGLQIEGIVFRLFPSEVCVDRCTTIDFGFSLGLML